MDMHDSDIQESTTYSCADFLLRMLNMLEENNVKPVFVYDGRSLAMKG